MNEMGEEDLKRIEQKEKSGDTWQGEVVAENEWFWKMIAGKLNKETHKKKGML